MKKISILLVMLMAFTCINAQKYKRASAYRYLTLGQLDKAKEAIEPTITNQKTMNSAKTWFYRGNIYLKIALSENKKYKSLDTNALSVAFESYKKALELDKKNEYKIDIYQNLNIIGEQFYNKGVDEYNKKMYAKAMNYFIKSDDINSFFGKADTLSMYVIYNAALCAELSNNDEKAKEYYNKLLEKKYKNPRIYSSLSSIYLNEKDTLQAENIVKIGRDSFPDDFNLIIMETNIFLATGETEKALNNLNIAIKKDTTNPTIYFAVGAQYNKILNDTTKSEKVKNNAFEKAEKSYKKALSIKPDYYDANYNLGALFVNKAALILEKANKLPLGDSKYDTEKAKADNYLNNSLPYLEKALEIKPDDINTLYSLKEIYARKKQYDKLKIINKKIQELKK